MKDKVKVLELSNAEILWLANLMCSEADGTEASNTLDKKIEALYQEVFIDSDKQNIR